ncbi:DNA helicase [Trifolium repens]|nr:DNA helicase [Trifolium repens]
MASHLPRFFQDEEKGWFTTIHTPDQAVGEIDPYFVAAFYDELGNNWEIHDKNGIPHNVTYNGSPTKPMLTSGWSTLRSFYSWSGNLKLALFYYGRNKFIMQILDNSKHVNPSFYPSFHTLSTTVGNYRTFFMRIGDDDVSSTTVRLSKDLQKFLSPAKNPTIKFSGPSDNIVKVNLIPDPTKARRFIFGEGWTTFCQVNQIENGKLLYLKADQNDEYSNIIIVQFA